MVAEIIVIGATLVFIGLVVAAFVKRTREIKERRSAIERENEELRAEMQRRYPDVQTAPVPATSRRSSATGSSVPSSPAVTPSPYEPYIDPFNPLNMAPAFAFDDDNRNKAIDIPAPPVSDCSPSSYDSGSSSCYDSGSSSYDSGGGYDGGSSGGSID